MSSANKDRKAVLLVSFLIASGLGILVIPWFLVPPAYLDLALRDAAFGSDLSRYQVIVTDQTTGKSMIAPIRRMGGAFVARIGRINSGKGAYRAQITGYKPGVAHVDAPALQKVRAPLELQPTFGRLEITPVNATRRDEAVAATVKEGGRTVTPSPQRTVVLDLPPGTHKLVADATGYCPSDRDYTVHAGKITKSILPLSPGLRDDEIARFVLGWHNEPRDLDSHFYRGSILSVALPDHLYYGRKSVALPKGGVFATLDVDELYPGRYETVTVRAAAIGDYKYIIHRYAGSGTIGDADAMVQVYTRGCHVDTFEPPPGCIDNVWNIVELHNRGGRVEVTPLNRCEAIPETPAPKTGY
jgi:hypothetical protein